MIITDLLAEPSGVSNGKVEKANLFLTIKSYIDMVERDRTAKREMFLYALSVNREI